MDDYAADDVGTLGAILAMGAVFMVIGLVVYVFLGFCLGKVFEKAGKPLWTGFVPIYNLIILLEIVGRPMWWAALFLAALIPFVGGIICFVLSVILCIDLAKSYGKDTLWGVLTAFFGIIMIPIMAFSDDIKYVGPSVAPAAASGGSSMQG